MAAAWQTETDAAETWARSLVNTTAGSRGWDPGWLELADEAIDEASPGWAARLWTDPQEFYAALTAEWEAAGQAGVNAGSAVPEGWDQLGNTWASAGQAAYSAAVEEDLGSVSGLVTGTVAASVQDVSDAGDAALGFWDPTKGWLDPKGYKFWGAAVGIGAVGWVGWKLTK